MAFEKLNVIIGRGRANNFSNSHGLTQHTYASGKDDNASISVAGYFPDYLGYSAEDVKVGDLLVVRDSASSFASYRIDTGSPLALTDVTTGGNTFDQDLNTTDPATFTTITATTGLLLPTVGGTPALLDYYESGSMAVTWTGAFTTPQPGNVGFSRIGKTVTLFFGTENAAQDSAGSVFLASGTIPSELQPTINVVCPVAGVSDNGTFVNAAVEITSTGQVLLTVNRGLPFSGVGNLLWTDFSATYIIT